MVIGTLSETIGCIGALSDLSEHYRKCSDSRRRLCRGSQLSELSDSHYRTIGEATIGLSELSEYYRSLLSDYRNRAQQPTECHQRKDPRAWSLENAYAAPERRPQQGALSKSTFCNENVHMTRATSLHRPQAQRALCDSGPQRVRLLFFIHDIK